MDIHNIPRDYVPCDYAEAVIFADRWYHDWGFSDYLEGFRHGRGYRDSQVPNFNRRGLISWALKRINE